MAAPPKIFDRQLLVARLRRATVLGASTFLLDHVAADLVDRLAVVLRRFECAADLGTPGDALRRSLAASGKVGDVVAADLPAEDGALPFEEVSLDLVVSAL